MGGIRHPPQLRGARNRQDRRHGSLSDRSRAVAQAQPQRARAYGRCGRYRGSDHLPEFAARQVRYRRGMVHRWRRDTASRPRRPPDDRYDEVQQARARRREGQIGVQNEPATQSHSPRATPPPPSTARMASSAEASLAPPMTWASTPAALSSSNSVRLDIWSAQLTMVSASITRGTPSAT